MGNQMIKPPAAADFRPQCLAWKRGHGCGDGPTYTATNERLGVTFYITRRTRDFELIALDSATEKLLEHEDFTTLRAAKDHCERHRIWGQTKKRRA